MKTVVSAEQADGIAERACDDDGNIYLGSDSVLQPEVRKLNSNGELVAIFKTDTNPDVKVGFGGSFFVTPDRELYQWIGEEYSQSLCDGFQR